MSTTVAPPPTHTPANLTALGLVRLSLGETNMTSRERRALSEEEPLKLWFRMNGIHPFDPAGNESYKKKKLAELQQPLTPDPEEQKVPGVFNTACIVGFALSCLMTLIGMLAFESFPFALILGVAVGALGFGFSFIVNQVLSLKAHMSNVLHPSAKWQVSPFYDLTEFEYWGGRVPDSVRETAARLEAELPGVQLELEWLYRDPFIWAKYENPLTGRKERFCFAFWDEDGFVA